MPEPAQSAAPPSRVRLNCAVPIFRVADLDVGVTFYVERLGFRLEWRSDPWGSRECEVTDPEGHVLRFGAESKPAEPRGDWLDGNGRRWIPVFGSSDQVLAGVPWRDRSAR